MLLQDALKLMKDGCQMIRAGWKEQDGYVVLMPGMTHCWKVVLKPTVNAGNFMWSYEDLTANDWEPFTVAKPEEV